MLKVLDAEDYPFSDLKDVHKYIRNRECYLATHNNKIIGTMILRFEDSSCEIYLISSKQKGAGTALVNFAIKQCIANKIPKLWCWSLARYNAKGFYKKMGFKELFLLKKQWHKEDCYFFGREIKAKN